MAWYKHERGWENSRQFMQTQDEVEGLHNTPRVSISAYANTGKNVSVYRYWWNTRIFPFTKKSYLHRAQWRYYFYLSRVRILVSPWLLTWLANYKRASRSGARPVLLKFHSQNGFEVRRQYSYQWLSRWAAKFSHRYFVQAWRTFRKICTPKKVVFCVGTSSVSI